MPICRRLLLVTGVTGLAVSVYSQGFEEREELVGGLVAVGLGCWRVVQSRACCLRAMSACAGGVSYCNPRNAFTRTRVWFL
jgi:hypothetical protein